jgi:hypothetical protein
MEFLDHIEKRPVISAWGDIPDTDVKLINDQVMKWWRSESLIMPGKNLWIDEETLTLRPHGIIGEITGIGVALQTFRATFGAHHVKHISLAGPKSWNKTAPQAVTCVLKPHRLMSVPGTCGGFCIPP